MRHSQPADEALKRMAESMVRPIQALTRQLEDEYEQAYVTTLILGINGNRLSKAQRERLREGLKMTNIVKEIWHDALDEGMQKGIEKGMETATIAELTGLGLTEVEELQNVR